jgi:Peptidase M50B-like
MLTRVAVYRVPRAGKLPRVHPMHLPLPAGESALIGLVAAAVVMVPLLGVTVEYFSGMTREGAHALLAVILGLTVTEILLDRHSGGRTSIAGEGLRLVLVLLIGYMGPSLFGLGAARLISLGGPVIVLWLLVLLLVLVLFLLGRSFGLLSVPFAIALLYLILRYSHGRSEVIAAYAVAWLLLLSGVRTAIAHGIHSQAADNLRSRTHVPRGFWWLLWLAGTVAALIAGGKLLILG